jgi:DNA repair protein RadC
MKVKTETHAEYRITSQADIGKIKEDEIIEQAMRILEGRMRTIGITLTSTQAVKQYLTMHLSELEHEVFGVFWLDAQNRLIFVSDLFRGTLTQSSVYPREVVKAALAANAAGCILYHNHPSGFPEPSVSDRSITSKLKIALELVDCKVLDHMIVGGGNVTSFAEQGLI